jgi:hypothetical protein
MLTDHDLKRIKEVLKSDFSAIRSDIKEVRTDIANHDQRYDELAESVNRLHDDLSVRRELERVKEIIREKLHVEI